MLFVRDGTEYERYQPTRLMELKGEFVVNWHSVLHSGYASHRCVRSPTTVLSGEHVI